uniref:Uncharacterized protein n=1 Tax=Saccharolobus islandicus TaxID=43080 RepID=Q54322_SACIS|nr:ORF90b; Method: conceptual translation supplied by author [Sulfolobus islandicus]BAF62548.1 orf90b [synthetic construct]
MPTSNNILRHLMTSYDILQILGLSFLYPNSLFFCTFVQTILYSNSRLLYPPCFYFITPAFASVSYSQLFLTLLTHNPANHTCDFTNSAAF